MILGLIIALLLQGYEIAKMMTAMLFFWLVVTFYISVPNSGLDIFSVTGLDVRNVSVWSPSS